MADDRWDVNESRQVKSVWVWRGFFLMSLVAVGIAIILGANRHPLYAIGWGVIGAGWFAISMWLWRQHTRMNQ